MTAALAVAATSEVLRSVVENALADASVRYGINVPSATTGAPPKAVGLGAEPDAVNLFLYSAKANPAYQGQLGAARDASGRRLHNAPLVLDLQYLVSAHGSARLVQEIGLGTALHALHQAGILPRTFVHQTLAALATDANTTLKAIGLNERLADQFECVTVSSLSQDLDILTKVWSAAQAPLRPSAMMLVTTVFLEDTKPARTIYPALSVGLSSAPLRALVLRSVTGERAGAPWPVSPAADIVIAGEGFADGGLVARLGAVALTPVPGASSATRLVLRPAVGQAGQLRAGPAAVELTLSGDIGGRIGIVQSASSVVLYRPTLGAMTVAPVDATTVNLTVAIEPPVGRAQRAILRLTPAGPNLTAASSEWVLPANNSAPQFSDLTFSLRRVPGGTYQVSVEIDGAESVSMPDANGVFGPRVIL